MCYFTDVPTFVSFHLHVEWLQQENMYLQKEATTTRSDHHQAESESFSQMKQLVAMLQESHHSLVATNAQLLREMKEAKERHTREVEQMHTNYEHLRRTVDIIHSTPKAECACVLTHVVWLLSCVSASI